MNLKVIIKSLVTIFLITTFLVGCKANNPINTEDNCRKDLAELESEIRNILDNAETDADFTLKIKSANGNVFTHRVGNSNEFTLYRSASTSKLVTAAVILSLVKKNILSLDNHPQDYISFWPTDGNLSLIKLRHLLNFTSGLVNAPFCIHLPISNFEACVEEIVNQNPNSKTPGEEFYYSPTHLQVAGLMAIKASGVSSWREVFANFKSETGLFPNSSYDLPSSQNPRLAGGMHWNAKDYVDFLEALFKKEILNEELISQMISDQISGASIGYSPALIAIGEDWHYGFGNWIECHANPFNCAKTTRISSPGAYGAYPFIDFENGYYGILAREGELGTFSKGYRLFESVAQKLEVWASMDCK